MEKALEIYKTTDYKKFKFMKENREPTHWEIIKGSIEQHDLTMYKPILVNEKFEIIDGQGTFLACKELKKPIYFVMGEKTNHEHLPILNTGQANWKTLDWLDHYVARRFKQYKKIKAMMDETGFRVHDILRIWDKRTANEAPTKSFKHGTFELPEEAITRIREVKTLMEVILKSWPADVKIPGEKKISSMIRGIIPLYRYENFSLQDLTENIEKYNFMLDTKGDAGQYKDMFINIYNRNRHGRNRLKK